jgi:2-oxoglutarate dehydrogenase E1 component
MNMRLPLVIFTPKSLLRHPMVTSTLEELARGSFKEVIDDPVAKHDEIDKLIFTSGRLYYDLSKYKLENGISNVAIVRIEQVYPTPVEQIDNLLKSYKTKNIIWAQDEPVNMGAWPLICRQLKYLNMTVVARPESASPAAGLMERHLQGMQKILEAVFETKILVSH